MPHAKVIRAHMEVSWPKGSHRLTPSTWRLSIGHRCRFRQASAHPRSRRPMAPSYINSRGRGKNRTSSHFTLPSLLDLRVALQRLGVKVLRKGASLWRSFPNCTFTGVKESWRSVGSIGTLLCLYLDGCLSIIVSIRVFLMFLRNRV